MKRLKILILIFCLALSIPLAYFVMRSYWSLHQEERAELRYFAVTLFDQMEEELASLVLKEERRPIDQYNYHYIPPDQVPGSTGLSRSPLSRLPKEHYILGYLQNNPDGSFQTPLVESQEVIPADRTAVVAKLDKANKAFNVKRATAPETIDVKPAEILPKKKTKRVSSFADKYLNFSRSKRKRGSLGQEQKRMEEITLNQALKLAKGDQKKSARHGQKAAGIAAKKDFAAGARSRITQEPFEGKGFIEEEGHQDELESTARPSLSLDTEKKFQVEVDPMQALFIDAKQILIFRRIVINNQIYRQGFVIKTEDFLNHLVDTYFVTQPMARFTNLSLRAMERGRETEIVQAGVVTVNPKFSLDRAFPRPFSFLRATISCDRIPRSVGRRILGIMMVVLASIILMGLFAIYQSARAVVDLSERRSGFVSSVTHELKTPLTNIRMYIEMLEQGIAQDPEREQEYYRILGSESARLSRLINNILEFSKLGKKQRHFALQEGILEEVIQEVEDVMHEKLRQEGFHLKIEKKEIRPFRYDREAMIQILINLIDNSMKFGKGSSTKEILVRLWPEGDSNKISVSDTGPGIPGYALKKVFDDFYRVDNDLTRTTGGTGIGLALVKKFVDAMSGSITATNNDGPGCTITISLPVS